MTQVKASGADGVYIGGIACFNGGQLVKDKVSVVGDNEAVKLMVSDGFVLDSLFDEAGADDPRRHVRERSGAQPGGPDRAPARRSSTPYTAKYGTPEVYTAYAAASAQVLLDAIGRSDGTS